jgi:hypothetical protein
VYHNVIMAIAFWILFGLCVLLALGGFFVAASSISDEGTGAGCLIMILAAVIALADLIVGIGWIVTKFAG